MNIFDSLQVFGKWAVSQEPGKEPRKFNATELACVDFAEVTAGDYGLSVCFHMKEGGVTYMDVARDVNANVGDLVDLTKCTILTLTKKGEDDIKRVQW